MGILGAIPMPPARRGVSKQRGVDVKNAAYAVILTVLFSGAALANDYPLGERSIFSDRATEERLRPVGSVCVQGQECGGTQMAAADNGGNAGPRSGQEIHDSFCSTCHASGAAGAPVTGEAGDWADRINKGMDTLVENAINGINAMPPKGMCSDCSEEEMRAAVKYMVDQSQ